MDPVKGAETEAIEKALRGFTEDPEIFALLYKALDQPYMALLEQKRILKTFIEAGRFNEAIEYGQKKRILAPEREDEIAMAWCESLMEKSPGEALGLARRYRFAGLLKKAARAYSELILEGKAGPAVEPALEIARVERAGDQDYRRRAARYAFKKYIESRSFPSLPRLVLEFVSCFSHEEVELASILDSVERECERGGSEKI